MSAETVALPLAVIAADAAPRPKRSFYPPPFSARVEGRDKRILGEIFGLKNFGVNLTRLEPGAQSALMHRHFKQDEFIYVLEGTPTLVTDKGEVPLSPGQCAGFAAGGVAHHLVNRSNAPVVFLEKRRVSAGRHRPPGRAGRAGRLSVHAERRHAVLRGCGFLTAASARLSSSANRRG
jgi:uncharacterized cupin superfamily protein